MQLNPDGQSASVEHPVEEVSSTHSPSTQLKPDGQSSSVSHPVEDVSSTHSPSTQIRPSSQSSSVWQPVLWFSSQSQVSRRNARVVWAGRYQLCVRKCSLRTDGIPSPEQRVRGHQWLGQSTVSATATPPELSSTAAAAAGHCAQTIEDMVIIHRGVLRKKTVCNPVCNRVGNQCSNILRGNGCGIID